MNFDFNVIERYAPMLLLGLQVTLLVTVIVFAIGAVLGLAVCFARISGNRALERIAGGYITFFRVTPELALIFWTYFCLPPLFNLYLSAFWSGTIALCLVAAAYMAEIYRAGIQAVPRGQVEAALALAVPPFHRWKTIILPQAVRRMMPAFLNYFTDVMKNSTLLSAIGVADLALQAYASGARSYRYLELLTFVGFLFFVLIYPLSIAVRVMEQRLRTRTGQ